MKTICLDPVTPPLLIAGHLSFVTVDRPPPDAECNCRGYAIGSYHSLDCATFGPSPWIGQRVAIYADRTLDLWQPAVDWWNDQPDATHNTLALGLYEDAIVGSGTLAEALPIYVKGDCGMTSAPHICVWGPNELVYYGEGIEARFISDQLPLQDWAARRWALRFTDVAPTGERCPKCWIEGLSPRGFCTIPRRPVVAPVLSGEGTYREWRTT